MTSIGGIELGLSLDRSGLDAELLRLESLQIAPLNLDVKLSKAGLTTQLKELQNGDYGSVLIDIAPDTKGFIRKLKELPKSLVDSIKVELTADFDSFKNKVKSNLSSLDNLKADIKINVDDTRLTELNKHLELKRSHFKSVQGYFNSSPLKPKIDDSGLSEAISTVKSLKEELRGVATSGTNLNIAASIQYSFDTGSIKAALLFGASEFRSAGDDVGDAIADKLKDVKLKTVPQGKGILGGIFGATGSVLGGITGAITGILPAIISPLIKVATAGTDQIIRETAKDLYRGAGVSGDVQKGGKATRDFTQERGGEFGDVIAKDLLLYQNGIKGIGEDIAGLSKKASDFLHPEPFFGTIGKIETRFAGFLHDTFYGAGVGAASQNLANDIARPFEQKIVSIKKLAYLVDTQVASQLKSLAKGDIKAKDLSKGAREVYTRTLVKADAIVQKENEGSEPIDDREKKKRVQAVLKDPTRQAELISSVSQDLIKEADAKALQRPLNVLLRAFRVTSGAVRKMNAIELDSIATELASQYADLIPDIKASGKKLLTIYASAASDFGRGSEEHAPVIQAAIPGSNVVSPTYPEYYFKRGKETGNVFHDTSDAIAKRAKGSLIAGEATIGGNIPGRSAEILTDTLSGFLFGYSKTVARNLAVRKAAIAKGYQPEDIQLGGFSAGSQVTRNTVDTLNLLGEEIKGFGVGIGDFFEALVPKVANYQSIIAKGDTLNLPLTEGLIPGSGKERILEPSIPDVDAHALPQVAAQKEFLETLKLAGIKGVRESEGINEKQLAYVFKDLTQLINSLRTVKLSENVRAGRAVGEGIVTRPTDPNRKFAAVEDFSQLVKTLKSGVSQFKQFAPPRLAATAKETGVAIDPELLGVANAAQIKLTTEITALANQLGVEGRTVKDSLKNLELVSPAIAVYEKTLKSAVAGTLDAAAAQQEIALSVDSLPTGALKTAMFQLVTEVADFDLGWIDKIESEFLQAASSITSFTAKDNQFKNRASIPNQVPQPATPVYDKPTVTSVAITKTVETTQTALNQLVQVIKTGASGVGSALANKTESALVTGVNSLLQKVPGQQNTLEANPRQVNALSQLQPQDYGRLAAHGASGLAGLGRGAAGLVAPGFRAAGQIAQGAESVALDLIPGGKAIKGAVKNVALPAAAFGAASQLPGGQVVAELATTLAHQLLNPIAHAVGTGIGEAASGGITQALAGTGFIGKTLAPALTGNITAAIQSISTTAGGVIAEVGTAVLGGRAILGAGGAVGKGAVKAILPSNDANIKALPPSNLAADTSKILARRIKSVESQTKAALLQFKEVAQAFEKAGAESKKLKQLQPFKAQEHVRAIFGNYERTIADIDNALSGLSAEERLSSKQGNQLANLKSRVVKAKNSAERLGRKIQGAVTNPLDTIDTAAHGGAIRVDATVVPDAISTGKSVVDGLTKGVSANTTGAEKSAADLAHGVIDTVESVLEIKSPSKVFFRIGLFVVEGLEKGLQGLNLDASLSKKIDTQLQNVKSKLKPLPPIETPLQINTRATGADLGTVAANTANAGLKTAKAVQETFKQATAGVPDALNAAKSGFSGFKDAFKEGFAGLEVSFPLLGKFKSGLKDIGLSALGLIGVFSFGDLFLQAGQSALQAAIDFDKLKTTLDFSSGGASAGAKNLAFVRDEVERLKIPLKEAQEGFAQLTASTRDTALEGQGTQILTTGVSEAASVLNLSADQIGGVYTALTQVASKGKVQAEELRGQLAERIPGAFQIAARAMGVTEAQLNKLMETGLVVSEEFLPRFGQQLHNEFGEASKTAANDAQSAIFDVQNQFLLLQEAVGKPAISALKPVLQGIAVATKFMADNVLLTTVAVGGLAVAIGVPLLTPIFKFLKTLPLIEAGMVGVRGSLNALKTSVLPLALIFTGVFLALESINAATQLTYGGPLTKSFEEFTTASNNALKSFKELKTEIETPTRRANFFDDLVNFGSSITEASINAGNLPKAEKEKQIAEARKRQIQPFFADEDSKKAVSTIKQNAKTLIEAGVAASKEVDLVSSGKSKLSQLPKIEFDIQSLQDQRKTLQGQITRNFSDKGLQTPSAFKLKLEGIDTAYNALIDKQSEFSKGGTKQYSDLKLGIDAAKSTLKSLYDPSQIAQFKGGEKTVAPIRKALEDAIAATEPKLNALADTLAKTGADPILKLTDAFRELNLELAKANEQSTLKFTTAKEGIAKDQLGGFSSDIFASRRASVDTATAERNRSKSELAAAEKELAGKQSAVSSSNFAPVLSRFGLDARNSAADIQGVIDGPGVTDDDKKVLEQIKAVKDAELSLHTTRTGFYDAEAKQKAENQAFALDSIAELTAQTALGITRAEDARTTAVKKGLSDRAITEEQGAVELAQITYGSTALQKQSVDAQLINLTNFYNSGIISAEKFHTDEAGLLTQQSGLKKSLAEAEFAVIEANNQKILAGISERNAAVGAAINLTRTQFGTDVKRSIKRGDITQERAAELGTGADIGDDQARIRDIKVQLEQTRYLEQYKVITAKTGTSERIRLNQELADAQDKLVSDQITKEQQYRDELSKTNDRIKARTDLTFAQRGVRASAKSLDTLKSPDTKDLKLVELQSGAIGLNDRSAQLKEQIALVQKQLAEIPKLGLAYEDAEDRRVSALKELAGFSGEAIQVEKDLYLNAQEQAINTIERRTEQERNRSELAIAGIESEKSALDLFNSSLDRSKQLLESRSNLSKALSDAAISQGENEVASLDQALEIRKKLSEEGLNTEARSALEGLSGGSGTELDILTQKQQIEDDIAAKKQAALVAEQKLAQELLRIDLIRQQIASNTAILDALVARDRALISQIEAVGELAKAEESKDRNAIEAAKLRLSLNERILDTTLKQIGNAQANSSIQDELAKNSIAALNAQQSGVLQSAAAADKLRNVSQDLLKIETAYPSSKSTGVQPEGIQPTEQKPALKESSNLVPTRKRRLGLADTIPDLAIRSSSAPDQSRSIGLNRDTSVESFLKRQQGLDTNENATSYFSRQAGLNPNESAEQYFNRASGFSGSNLANQVKSTAVTPKDTTAGFADSLRMANRDVVSRLDKLIEVNAAAAASPRTLNISSPKPVQDASKIYSDLSRAKVSNAKL